MNYRKKLYSSYVSSHAVHLYGNLTIEHIKKKFPVWQWHFGKFLLQNKDAKIIDIGCGNGEFVYFLQNCGFKNAKGIDVSEEQIELAHKLGINNVSQYNLEEFLAVNPESYDILFARDIIEHFTKDEILHVLNLIFFSLKRGGTVVIQTPNAASPFGGHYRYGDFTHEIAFTKSSLNQVLRAVGFRDTAFYPTGPVPHGFKLSVRYILWKIVETVLKFYMRVEGGTSPGIFTQNIIAVARK